MTSAADSPVADLVESAIADPRRFLDAAPELLDAADGRRRVEILRAMGVAHREARDITRSVELLEEAQAAAMALGDRRLAALVELSLAATALFAGDSGRAIRLVDGALDDVSGADRFLALGQRAGILYQAGHLRAAARAFDVALRDEGAAEPTATLGELLNNRGILSGFLGRYDDAESDFATARRIFISLVPPMPKRAAEMVQNLGWLAGRRGDLALALELLDNSRDEMEALGLSSASIVPDRCEVLLAAGLLHEALTFGLEASESFRASAEPKSQAESLVMASQIALRLGEWTIAADSAAIAAELLLAGERAGWWEYARALGIEAALGSGVVDRGVLDDLEGIRRGLDAAGLRSARADCDLLQARILVFLGDPHAERAVAALRATSLAIHARPAARALKARTALARGDLDAARRHIARGLDDVELARAALGSTELRVAIGFHADDLAQLGVQLAVASGRPAAVMRWCERGRARSLRHRPLMSTGRDELDVALATLRRLETQLEMSAPGAEGTSDLRATIDRTATAIRHLSRHGTGTGTLDTGRPTVAAIRRALGGALLVQLVDVGRTMWAVSIDSARTDLRAVGPSAEIEQAAVRLRGSLGRGLTTSADERIRKTAQRYFDHDVTAFEHVLARTFDDDAGRPIVIVPTPALITAPWSLVPALAGRPVVVTPSIETWLVACGRAHRPQGRLLVANGPGLAMARSEAIAVAGTGSGAHVLLDGEATVGAVANGLAAADTAHLVCHGRFVPDNHLRSSLAFADGQLMLYDIERQPSVPEVVVLSACYAGMTADLPGEEMMGFVASLLGAGCSSIIASAVPVPDDGVTLDAMVTLHEMLAAGVPPSVAALAVRANQPLIGAAFTVFGQG